MYRLARLCVYVYAYAVIMKICPAHYPWVATPILAITSGLFLFSGVSVLWPNTRVFIGHKTETQEQTGSES